MQTLKKENVFKIKTKLKIATSCLLSQQYFFKKLVKRAININKKIGTLNWSYSMCTLYVHKTHTR